MKTDGGTCTAAADMILPGNPSHTYSVSDNSCLPFLSTGYDAYHAALMAAPMPDNLGML